jgi:uncharacterized protein YhhL (DUF1145 family)
MHAGGRGRREGGPFKAHPAGRALCILPPAVRTHTNLPGDLGVFTFLNKILLLAVYGVAVASFLTALPLSHEVIHWVRIAALVLMAVHLLEVVVYFKKVALHRGPLFDSVLLTLLFGFLHWKPMADAASRTR